MAKPIVAGSPASSNLDETADPRIPHGSLIGWRKNASDLLESVMHLANDAGEIGESGLPHGRLLYRAHVFALEVQDNLYVVATTRSGTLDQLWDLQAYFIGVAQMKAAPASVQALAQKAWDMIEADSAQFDTLDVDANFKSEGARHG